MQASQSQRQAILQYAAEQYGTEPEYPWESTPDAAVLRHTGNSKWYGLLMRIPAKRLGIASDTEADILNVKCDPLETGSLQQKPGIFPAYHMNKTHWITILLDGTVPTAEIFQFLDESFYLTSQKQRKQKGTQSS